MATRTKKTTTAPKVIEKKAEEPFGLALYKATQDKRDGKESRFTGHAFVKAETNNRRGGIGKRIFDFLISGETYEELKARLKVAIREGKMDIPSYYIYNHLDYDQTNKNFTVVPYIDKAKTELVNPIPEELKAARQANGLPALDS